MKTLTVEAISKKIKKITHIVTDVDGVHTGREKGVSICELLSDKILGGFTEVNGDTVRALIPCNLDGTPEKENLQYVAGEIGQKVFEIYNFNIPDGQGVVSLVSYGFEVLLISGRDSPCVRARAERLGANVALGVKEKYKWLKAQEWFVPELTLVVSDNNSDADLLRAVRDAGGIAIAPADAESEALEAVEFVTEAKGGKGVIAEIAKAFTLALDL